jgi:hypothetical protein
MPWSWGLVLLASACTVRSATFQSQDAPLDGDASIDGTPDACVPGTARVPIPRQPIDMIFVVDNSGDMVEEVTTLVGLINEIVMPFTQAAVDLRTIVISGYGAPPDVCVPEPLGGAPCTAATPTNTTSFFHYTRETSSFDAWCDAVAGYATADTAGLAPNGWSAWAREDAFKVFVVLSSDALNCGGHMDGGSIAGGMTAAASLDTAIRALSPAQFGTATDRRYTVMSIHNTITSGGAPLTSSDPLSLGRCDTGTGHGTGHAGISILTNGYRYASCVTADYSAVFTSLTGRATKLAIACEIEPDAPVTADDAVSMRNGSATIPLTRVASSADCTADAYYLDAGAISLCPTTCEAVRATGGLDLDVEYTCP